jgi:hypothetical protein
MPEQDFWQNEARSLFICFNVRFKYYSVACLLQGSMDVFMRSNFCKTELLSSSCSTRDWIFFNTLSDNAVFAQFTKEGETRGTSASSA